MTPAALAASPLVAQQIPVGADVDEATVQTIQQMAAYVRQSVNDPLIQAAARRAVETFGLGCDSDQAKLWAVFWWVKHAVQFESDENTLLKLGRRGEQDLLISPSVLLRMKRPKEDCDGFSMLVTCMLACLGVPVGLVAVAVEPDDPERWSHVFGLAQVDGEVVPIDASHGLWPGWMVPRSRIYRWQVFGLDGRPMNVPVPRSRFRGLHGYVPAGRGMGNMICDDSGCYDDGELLGSAGGGGGGSPVNIAFPLLGGPSGSGGGGSTASVNFPWLSGSGSGSSSFPSMANTLSYPTGSTAPGAPAATPSWLNSLVSNSFGLATRVLAPNYQSTYVRDPVTGQLVQSTVVRAGPAPSASMFGSSSTGSGISPTMLMVGVGLLALVGLAASSKGRG